MTSYFFICFLSVESLPTSDTLLEVVSVSFGAHPVGIPSRRLSTGNGHQPAPAEWLKNTIVVWVCWGDSGDSWLVLSTSFNPEKNGGYDSL